MIPVSAVFMRTALISSGERLGHAPWSRAAAPDTIGAAPAAPPNGSRPVPVPATAETEAPGAPMSGLSRLVRLDGPRDDEPTMWPTSAIPAAGSKVTRVVGAFMAVDVAWLTMKPGIAAHRLLGQSPSEPSNGSPGVMRPMTPMAPLPAAMLAIFALKLQVPRSTRTTLPASVPAANGRHPSTLPPAPSPNWTGTLVFASAAEIGLDHDWATASVGTNGPPLRDRPIAKPVEDGTAVWATEITDLAED